MVMTTVREAVLMSPKRIRIRDYSGQYPLEKTLEGFTGSFIDKNGIEILVEDGIIIGEVSASPEPEIPNWFGGI